jgi:hypothetical protein
MMKCSKTKWGQMQNLKPKSMNAQSSGAQLPNYFWNHLDQTKDGNHYFSFLQHQLGETKVIEWQNNLGASIALHCYHFIFFFGSPIETDIELLAEWYSSLQENVLDLVFVRLLPLL